MGVLFFGVPPNNPLLSAPKGLLSVLFFSLSSLDLSSFSFPLCFLFLSCPPLWDLYSLCPPPLPRKVSFRCILWGVSPCSAPKGLLSVQSFGWGSLCSPLLSAPKGLLSVQSFFLFFSIYTMVWTPLFPFLWTPEGGPGCFRGSIPILF